MHGGGHVSRRPPQRARGLSGRRSACVQRIQGLLSHVVGCPSTRRSRAQLLVRSGERKLRHRTARRIEEVSGGLSCGRQGVLHTAKIPRPTLVAELFRSTGRRCAAAEHASPAVVCSMATVWRTRGHQRREIQLARPVQLLVDPRYRSAMWKASLDVLLRQYFWQACGPSSSRRRGLMMQARAVGHEWSLLWKAHAVTGTSQRQFAAGPRP